MKADTVVPISSPPLRPSRLSPLAEAQLRWQTRDAINATLQEAKARVVVAGVLNAVFLAPKRRATRGRP